LRAHCLLVLVGLLSLAGCATSSSPEKEVQRAVEGPTAKEMFTSRFLAAYNRLPTYDETIAFQSDIEERVSTYLAKHPDLSTSSRASQFTFQPRVSVGMTKEEVVLLAGLPYQVTPDEAQMELAAQQFWPAVKVHAKEMWIYPGGWQFYFDTDQLVDLTVLGKPPL